MFAMGGRRKTRGDKEVITKIISFVDQRTFQREMWSLFNLNDNPTLREQDLVQGVTTVCQQASQEFFDFYPAVRFKTKSLL